MNFRRYCSNFFLGGLLLGIVAGCSSLPSLPPVRLGDPGWVVQEGQAVWCQDRRSPGIAGEVLAAVHPDGSALVQFSKAPFALVIARVSSNCWEIEFPPRKRRYAGPGSPPKRLIWLHLARVLSGQPPPRNWIWRNSTNSWMLTDPSSGASLEGYFNR